MKKIVALLLVLCLVCVSAAALAEAVTEAKTVDLGSFSLSLEAGEYYAVGEKAMNQVHVLVYPYFADGDQSSNYNFIWAGDAFEVTPETVQSQVAEIEETLRAQLTEAGVTVDSFTAGEPYDATLNDVPCVALELTMDISAFGMTMTIYEREILLGSMGYIVTLSALSTELLDEMTQKMANALTIN